MFSRSVGEESCREVKERSVGEECWERSVVEIEKCWRRELQRRVVAKCWRRVWRKECCGERSVGEECPQGRWLQRFLVVVELTPLEEILDVLRVGVYQPWSQKDATDTKKRNYMANLHSGSWVVHVSLGSSTRRIFRIFVLATRRLRMQKSSEVQCISYMRMTPSMSRTAHLRIIKTHLVSFFPMPG